MKSTVKSSPNSRLPELDRIDRRIAILLAAGALGIYVRTLAPGLLAGDPGEFQFAAWRFGLAHPTGYPLYLILGGIWQRIVALFGADPAFALNLFSAVTAAAAVGLLYLLVLRWLSTRDMWSRLTAFFAALLFALNPTAWGESVIAEVYALHVLLIVMVLLAAQQVAAPRGYPRWQVVSSEKRQPVTLSPGRPLGHLVILSLLFGLALTHHRTSLFLLPGIAFFLFWLDRRWWRSPRTVIAMIAATALPQLLYAYVPLRSGPVASPWLYQRLNGETLVLYEQSWQGFVDFLTGRVFAVSFLGIDGALARLPQMAEFWLLHFQWTGLALMGIGLIWLVRQRRWDVILLTVPFVFVHQVFNLFYGIGDIHVYYIALYLIGSIWAGFGVWSMGQGAGGGRQEERQKAKGKGQNDASVVEHPSTNSQLAIHNSQFAIRITLYVAILLFTLLPLLRFYPEVDQSNNTAARARWSAILAADPPADAILVSNDRNEIVPLYYLQAVEGIAEGMTGIFPLLTPEDRFADVGAVIEAALAAGDRPVYLIKPMEGLDVRFDLEEAADPLVRVDGVVEAVDLTERLDRQFGPLTLLGYRWDATATELALYWQANERIEATYTTTVQLFNGEGNKVAQSDKVAGGVYYPTSLWKVGDVLHERHRLDVPAGMVPQRVLVGMYRRPPAEGDGAQPELIDLAPSVEWELP